jgi:hypothetical protein
MTHHDMHITKRRRFLGDAKQHSYTRKSSVDNDVYNHNVTITITVYESQNAVAQWILPPHQKKLTVSRFVMKGILLLFVHLDHTHVGLHEFADFQKALLGPHGCFGLWQQDA